MNSTWKVAPQNTSAEVKGKERLEGDEEGPGEGGTEG